MRILYGVVGEGMGHATRSKVTISYLLSRGHQVKVAASNRACAFLVKQGFDCVEITGLEFRYSNNAVDLGKTLVANVQTIPQIITMNAEAFHTVDRFAPQFVISDFESFAYLYGKTKGLPVVSIDNGQMLDRCVHPPEITQGIEGELAAAAAFVHHKLPFCEHYVITTFFYPPIKPEYQANTALVPPILRQEIIRTKPSISASRHVLVYQTSESDSRLLGMLNMFPSQAFIVYGLRRDAVQGNCIVKSFREQEFIDDLASAAAVITNGGMSLIGEAVYFGKPVYSIPIQHQAEQALNARYIAGLGYGMTSDVVDAQVLGEFLAKVPEIAAGMCGVLRQRGNEVLYGVVDRLLADVRVA